MRLRTDIDGMTSQQVMAIVVFRLVEYSLSYDAWGQQSVTVNTIGLRRGYTGHEMLPEFGIINMNGRLYDPVLGRFFSPDPFVQMPGSPQGFNRYSYCLNNPLKYTDPSGQFLSPALLFGIFNLASSMMQAAANGGNVWKAAGNGLKSMALGLVAQYVPYGIGEVFGKRGNIGKELLRAGTHGVASGVLNMLDGGNFGSGLLSGAASSITGSYVLSAKMSKGFMITSTALIGGTVAWGTGDDFLKGAVRGMLIGLMNHSFHDPEDITEMAKEREREKIRENPKYKKKIIDDMEKDGKLSFSEAYSWYIYGDGTPIEVDASKLDLGRIDITGKKIGGKWSIQTLSLSGNPDVGLVYGRITVVYEEDGLFSIESDKYDFDIQKKDFFSWPVIIRNLQTIGACFLHGTGTPFEINFNGYYKNKK